MAKLVRLKPYNSRRGFLTRSYTLEGIRIREEDGWHEVPDDLAQKFAEVRVSDDNPEAPFMFDVMDRDEALRYEAEQKRLAQRQATAEDPIRVRRVRPVDDARAEAAATHYGRPPGTSANRARTHLARPDESEASRDVSALTNGEVPGAPRRNAEEEPGDEYAIAVADLGGQVVKQQSARAAEQAPFRDGSQVEVRVSGPDKRNPDPRNLGERARGAFDDTPFVDGSRDAVVPSYEHGADPRNPDPRNTGARAAGAFDDTPFVDGSRDAVVPPFAPRPAEDDALSATVTADGRALPRLGIQSPKGAQQPQSRTRARG